MKLKPAVFFLAFFLVVSCTNNKESSRLHSFIWSLHDTGDSINIENAKLSDVHLSLLENKIITDPFYRDNENKLQWIGEKDWVFETDFDLSRRTIEHENVNLVFEGLDTYATVFLNGKQILQADNMHRHWVLDVKTLLKENDNTMKIVFTSPIRINREKQDQLPYQLPEIWGFTRKAAYQFGWDWGPRFVTMGVWRPAYFEAWSNAKINDVFIEQQSVNTKKARLSAEIAVAASRSGSGKLILFNGDEKLKEMEFSVVKGMNRLDIPFTIDQPDLWWPNGMGDAHLYDFRVELQMDGKQIDEKYVKTGLREIKLVQENDSIGKSFYFKVNGKALFVKGANYVPQDNFLSRISEENYHQLFETVVASHMNMLRVWGGGIYEDDLFYQLCDENGILVWQDFMFAGTIYPGDSAFVENVKAEAQQNIERLRNHPSIALWCGNNEIDEAWHNWGWQKSLEYSKKDSTEIWNNYLNLFEEVLPSLVKKYHPTCDYWPSSPSNGWGTEKAFLEGDVHYWGVWWGREPFSSYEKYVGRFNSEYGFQGMPDLKTIDEFTISKDRNLGSEVMNIHQKHPFGWEAIQQYIERDYKVPNDFADYVYVSQLLQAKGLKTAIEAHRRAQPRCMGTLYWQLNDCWPVTSWSSVDYFGRWKASQYAVKEAYRMCLVSFEEHKNGIDIYAVTDDYNDKNVKLKWYFQSLNGAKSKKDSSVFFLPANTSIIAAKLPKHRLPKGKNKNKTMLIAELWYGSNMLYRAMHYFAKPKELALQKSNIKIKFEKTDGGYFVYLMTNKLAKNVFLSIDADGHLEQNYFDLLPWEERKVFLKTKETDLSDESIVIRSLIDTY